MSIHILMHCAEADLVMVKSLLNQCFIKTLPLNSFSELMADLEAKDTALRGNSCLLNCKYHAGGKSETQTKYKSTWERIAET